MTSNPLAVEVLKEMTNKNFVDLLIFQRACPESIEWCREHGGTPEELFYACEHGEWLGWFIGNNLELLGYSYKEWASGLANAIEETLTPMDVSKKELVKLLREYADGKISYGACQAMAYSYGLTERLNFPRGHSYEPSIDSLRRDFPIFEKEVENEIH